MTRRSAGSTVLNRRLIHAIEVQLAPLDASSPAYVPHGVQGNRVGVRLPGLDSAVELGLRNSGGLHPIAASQVFRIPAFQVPTA